MAGTQGGLSGILSGTGVVLLGQVVGNALITGGGSKLKGDKLMDAMITFLSSLLKSAIVSISPTLVKAITDKISELNEVEVSNAK